jgi:hypothetical protein
MYRFKTDMTRAKNRSDKGLKLPIISECLFLAVHSSDYVDTSGSICIRQGHAPFQGEMIRIYTKYF